MPPLHFLVNSEHTGAIGKPLMMSPLMKRIGKSHAHMLQRMGDHCWAIFDVGKWPVLDVIHAVYCWYNVRAILFFKIKQMFLQYCTMWNLLSCIYMTHWLWVRTVDWLSAFTCLALPMNWLPGVTRVDAQVSLIGSLDWVRGEGGRWLSGKCG